MLLIYYKLYYSHGRGLLHQASPSISGDRHAKAKNQRQDRMHQSHNIRTRDASRREEVGVLVRERGGTNTAHLVEVLLWFCIDRYHVHIPVHWRLGQRGAGSVDPDAAAGLIVILSPHLGVGIAHGLACNCSVNECCKQIKSWVSYQRRVAFR